MRAPRLVATWIVGLAALAGAGCNDYHYYDIDVSFNANPASGGFAAGEIAQIQVAVMSVTGADSGTLYIGPSKMGLPLTAGATHLGIVEFATFADSGDLTFTLRGYNGQITDACKVAEGAKTITATSASTTMDSLTVNKFGAGCP